MCATRNFRIVSARGLFGVVSSKLAVDLFADFSGFCSILRFNCYWVRLREVFVLCWGFLIGVLIENEINL